MSVLRAMGLVYIDLSILEGDAGGGGGGVFVPNDRIILNFVCEMSTHRQSGTGFDPEE